MLGKRPRPIIGKLSELLGSGYRPGFLDACTSPKSPLDFKVKSPRGLKSYDLGGVGLGIVAALEKSVCGPNLSRSNAILVSPVGRNSDKVRGRYEDSEMESLDLENYTYVTCRGPNNTPFTKVYYDGGEQRSGHPGGGPYLIRSGNFETVKEPAVGFVEDVSAYPTSDFLSSCHLCRKKLHGKDIYMYRGEKAFCSPECRSRQIMMDERKEQCRSEASRSAKLSSSPYNTDQIFSTGILAI